MVIRYGWNPNTGKGEGYSLYAFFLLDEKSFKYEKLDVWDSIPAPPLFIEEVAAVPTEEFFI